MKSSSFSTGNSSIYSSNERNSDQERKIVVVLKKEGAINHAKFYKFLIENMAYFMVPRYINFLEELPKNKVHRILKQDLKKRGVTESTYDREMNN